MADAADIIYDVTEADFDERVVGASCERVVVVDFWSPGCAPCRMLTPALESAVASFGGELALAKVNVDEASGLAARFDIRSVPTVKVFRDGEVVAAFVGAVGEADVRRMLSSLVPSEADRLAARAAELAEAGRLDEAKALFRSVLEKQSDHAAALVGLSLVELEKGNHDEAREALVRVTPGSPGGEQAEGLLARLEFLKGCAEAGGSEAAEKALADAPDDTDAMYAAATCLAAAERYAEALGLFLRVVERDKSFRDGAAKEAMVRVFSIVGKRSELADEFRSKLARTLY